MMLRGEKRRLLERCHRCVLVAAAGRDRERLSRQRRGNLILTFARS